MRTLTAVATMMLATNVYAKTITVAVVDTGFDMNSQWKSVPRLNIAQPKICKMGHWNFVGDNEDVTDNHGHGTHIAGVIAKGNENVDYCMVIMKYYDPKAPGTNNLNNTVKAFRRAVNIKVDVINYSGGGTELSKEECSILKKALDKGIEVVAAAGNEKSDLDSHPYYPALCDSRIRVVENIDKDGNVHSLSNYSKTKYRTYAAVGVNVISTLPHNSYGYMTGTSQSTAVVTSSIVRQLAANKIQPTSYAHCSKDYMSQVLCELEYKRSMDMCNFEPRIDLREYESGKRKEAQR